VIYSRGFAAFDGVTESYRRAEPEIGQHNLGTSIDFAIPEEQAAA